MVSAAVDFDRAGSRRPTEHTRDLDWPWKNDHRWHEGTEEPM